MRRLSWRPRLRGGDLFQNRRAEHLMAMPDTMERWTAARVRELPDDGNRYEVVDGELLVTPSPTYDHQDVVGELFAVLREFCLATGAGHAMVSPADIEFDPDTLVQPDVFIVP